MELFTYDQRLNTAMKIKTLLLLAALLLTACATDVSDALSPPKNQNPVNLGGSQIPNPVDPSIGDTPVPMEDLTTQQTSVPEAAIPLVNIAIQDLAQRLGVGLDEITVAHFEEVDWPDASLGCPQPGIDYGQVITPGYQIVLSSAEEGFNYHADKAGIILLCENPPGLSFPTLPPPKDADDRNPWQPIDPLPTINTTP